MIWLAGSMRDNYMWTGNNERRVVLDPLALDTKQRHFNSQLELRITRLSRIVRIGITIQVLHQRYISILDIKGCT